MHVNLQHGGSSTRRLCPPNSVSAASCTVKKYSRAAWLSGNVCHQISVDETDGELDSGFRHSAEGDLWRPNKRRVMTARTDTNLQEQWVPMQSFVSIFGRLNLTSPPVTARMTRSLTRTAGMMRSPDEIRASPSKSTLSFGATNAAVGTDGHLASVPDCHGCDGPSSWPVR